MICFSCIGFVLFHVSLLLCSISLSSLSYYRSVVCMLFVVLRCFNVFMFLNVCLCVSRFVFGCTCFVYIFYLCIIYRVMLLLFFNKLLLICVVVSLFLFIVYFCCSCSFFLLVVHIRSGVGSLLLCSFVFTCSVRFFLFINICILVVFLFVSSSLCYCRFLVTFIFM